MRPLFDLRIVWAAFLLAAFAELGCLARTGAIAARFGSPLSVCLGTLLGNLLLLLPVLLLGEELHRLPAAPIRWVSGGILILMGLLILIERGI